MKALLLALLALSLLSACGDGGSGGQGSSNESQATAPVGSPAPVNPASPSAPVNDGAARLNLSSKELNEISGELKKLVRQSQWNELNENEKKNLVGAWLEQATQSVKPLSWDVMADEDLTYLVKLYFDDNLILKGKGQ